MTTSYHWLVPKASDETCAHCGQIMPQPWTTPLGDMIDLRYADKYAPEIHIGNTDGWEISWACDPEKFRAVCRARPDEPLIVDEYGRVETCGEFLRWLDERKPREHTDLVGQWFQ